MKIRNYLDCIEDKKVWDILRVFVDGAPFITGRQMAYLLNMNHKTCTRYLEQLQHASILDRQVEGRAYLYSLKKNYMTQKVLIPLINQEKDLYGHVIEDIVSLLKVYCHSIIVSGDYAKRTESDNSGLEICFVRNDYSTEFFSAVESIRATLQEEYGVVIQERVVDIAMLSNEDESRYLESLFGCGEWIHGDENDLRKVWDNKRIISEVMPFHYQETPIFAIS